MFKEIQDLIQSSLKSALAETTEQQNSKGLSAFYHWSNQKIELATHVLHTPNSKSYHFLKLEFVAIMFSELGPPSQLLIVFKKNTKLQEKGD